MTLHLQVSNLDCVMHVCDRRLTTRVTVSGDQEDGYEIFDENANKIILVFTRTGRLTIGYSGLSWIEGRPTDQWIVEQMTGDDFGEFKPWKKGELTKSSFVTMRSRGAPPRPPIGKMLSNLKVGLARWRQDPTNRAFLNYPISISASGYRVDRRERRKIVYVRRYRWMLELAAKALNPVLLPTRLTSRVFLSIIDQTPAVIRSDKFRSIHQEVLAAREKNSSCYHDDALRTLVSAALEAASGSDLIGSNIVGVSMPHPYLCVTRKESKDDLDGTTAIQDVPLNTVVKFFENDSHSAAPVCHSPWIVYETSDHTGHHRPQVLQGLGMYSMGVGRGSVELHRENVKRPDGGLLTTITANQPRYWRAPAKPPRSDSALDEGRPA